MNINLTVNRSNDVAIVLPAAQRVNTVVEEKNTITISPLPSVSLSNISNLNELSITNISDIGDLALGDLYDVETSGVSDGQVLSYDADTNTYSFVDVGSLSGTDHVITNSITVTNLDGGFSHILGSTYTSGTQIEDILKEILEPYNPTAIYLNYLMVSLDLTDGTQGPPQQTSSSLLVEVGRRLEVTGFKSTVAEPEQTTDNSVTLFANNSIVEGGFADDTTEKTLASADVHEYNTPATVTYYVSALDSGGDGGSSQVITSNSIQLEWKYRVKLGASSVASISSSAEAESLFDSINLPVNQLRSELDITTTANAAMDTAGNYTWIMYPSAFGPLTDVLVGATSVLSDFESPVTYNITNQYGATNAYLFYRSTYDDAFAEGQQVKVDF